LLELAQQLNETGDYYALYCSLETAQGINEAKEGIPAIVKALKFPVEMNELSHYPFAQSAYL